MKNVAVKTIGTVEAGMNYATIHAPDTLSLGIGQWAMERAYDLLMRFSNRDFGPTINSWLAQGVLVGHTQQGSILIWVLLIRVNYVRN